MGPVYASHLVRGGNPAGPNTQVFSCVFRLQTIVEVSHLGIIS